MIFRPQPTPPCGKTTLIKVTVPRQRSRLQIQFLVIGSGCKITAEHFYSLRFLTPIHLHAIAPICVPSLSDVDLGCPPKIRSAKLSPIFALNLRTAPEDHFHIPVYRSKFPHSSHLIGLALSFRPTTSPPDSPPPRENHWGRVNFCHNLWAIGETTRYSTIIRIVILLPLKFNTGPISTDTNHYG